MGKSGVATTGCQCFRVRKAGRRAAFGRCPLQGVAAIHGIDLTIRDGEFFSLLGPSGCGKTSTLNVIGGFIEPSTGDVLIQGQIRAASAAVSARR